MPEIVPVVLASWVVLSVVLFWRLPGRDAALIVLIGGWAFLPVGSFPASVFAEPLGSAGRWHALAVPTALLANKATAIALGCLAGSMIFDWPALRRVRPFPARPADVDLVPDADPLGAGQRPGTAEGLAQVRYLTLAWGVPYLMGRAYLVDNESLRRLGLGLVLAGLAYVPLCLVEFVAGPFLYTLVLRPSSIISLKGDKIRPPPSSPLQRARQTSSGCGVASAAVCATWLWRSGRMSSVMGVPGGVVAAVPGHALPGLPVAGKRCADGVRCSSALSVATGRRYARTRLVLGRPCWSWSSCSLPQSRSWGWWWGSRAGPEPGRRRRKAIVELETLPRSWEHLPQVAPRPWLGWGRADWSGGGAAGERSHLRQPGEPRALAPDAGEYGVVGLVSSTLVLTLQSSRWFDGCRAGRGFTLDVRREVDAVCCV